MAKFFDRITSYLRHDTTTGIQLREMDAFRGWAVLGVLLLHCSGDAGRWTYFAWKCGQTGYFFIWPFRQGWAGLDLFFFISGFLLFLKFGKAYYQDKTVPAVRNFYKRRLLRIGPAYYVSVFIIVVFYGSFFTAPPFNNYGIIDILQHVTFTYNLNPKHSQSINPVYWTLAIEAQFYLVLPFIASWFHGKRSLLALPAILVASALYKLVVLKLAFSSLTGRLDTSFAVTPYNQLLWRLDEFAIGICFANLWLYVNYGNSPPAFLTGKKFANTMAVSGMLGLLAIFWVLGVGSPNTVIEILLVPVCLGLCFGLLIYGTLYSGILKKVIANPAVEFIGILSYSIYIWHFVVLKMLAWRYPPLTAPGLETFLLLIAIVLTLSVLVGLVSYLLFERPFLKRRRRGFIGRMYDWTVDWIRA